MQTRPFFVLAPSKSQRARMRLLEAGLELFGEKGLKEATVREIASAAGQNVAAIAYYFGSKDDLHRAVIEGIVSELRRRLGDVLGAVEELQRQTRPEPESAARLLAEFLRAVYLRLLSRNETVPIARLIVREQMQAGRGFELLYSQAFRIIHEALSFLVGTALGRDPRARETIVRTHLIMGQVYFFAMSRQAILRRMGWKDLEGRNAELVAALLAENVGVLLSVLRGRNRAETKVKS